MEPSTTALTRCKLGFQRRFVTLCAWDTLLPKRGPLPQIWQNLDIGSSSREPQIKAFPGGICQMRDLPSVPMVPVTLREHGDCWRTRRRPGSTIPPPRLFSWVPDFTAPTRCSQSRTLLGQAPRLSIIMKP